MEGPGLARCGDAELALPLVELEVVENEANFQLVEDYWRWFWNWQRPATRPLPNRPR